jgi:hypothetical protein
MGATPPPVQRKGGGIGLIVGIVVGAIVLGAGGYFGYKKFLGPKEPGQEVAQNQQTVQPGDQAAVQPDTGAAGAGAPSQSQPVDSGAGTGTPPVTQAPATQAPPVQSGARQPSGTPATSQPWTTQQAAPPPQQSQQSAPVATPPRQEPTAPPPPTRTPVPVEQRQPILQPERSYPAAPVTTAPQQSSAPPSSTAARYTGPSSGMLMWLGKLDKNGVVTIEGNKASAGTLTGSLPGVPVTLETDLTNIGFAEMPSPSNGWKKVSLRSKKSQNIVISIRWKVLD